MSEPPFETPVAAPCEPCLFARLFDAPHKCTGTSTELVPTDDPASCPCDCQLKGDAS